MPSDLDLTARVRVEKPILFSAPMVRAILDGRKTQTRRTLKDAPSGSDWHCDRTATGLRWVASAGAPSMPVRLRWSVGDRLWVRETWGFNPDHPSDPEFACFRADPGHEHDGIRWRPSIHMPRRVSRITLEVTDVRVKRLQDISEEDAIAEGVTPEDDGFSLDGCSTFYHRRAAEVYWDIWEQINGAGSWDANPFVVALTFRRVSGAD